MKYGLPYKGSKNKLAERIVHLLPKRKNLVDLFCGGCAVSHAALLMKKYEHIYINDVNWMCPTLFMDALAGKYNNETRWISREDFFRLKDTDPYVAVVWSFGNNMRDYLYSKEIEPLKKAIHYAMFFGDYSLAKELGHDLSFIEPIKDMQQRYLAVKHYFSRLGHFQQQSYEGGVRLNWNRSPEPCDSLNTNLQNWGGVRNASIRLETAERSTNVRRNFNISNAPTEWLHSKKKIDRAKLAASSEPVKCRECNSEASEPTALHRLQYRERQHSLPHLNSGGRDLPITSSVLDYAAFEVPQDSVIYCDIPYENTNVYNKEQGYGFDYERFYSWAERQSEPVFISSYQMPPDRFDCIIEFNHRSTLSATANNAVKERIFVPKHQKERGNIPHQLSLFDGL